MNSEHENLNFNFLLNLMNVECEGFKIFFYNEFKEVFFLNGQISEQIDPAIWNELKTNLIVNKADFRVEMTLKSVPFLVAYFFKLKEIRIYTPKLSQELFLLQQNDLLELPLQQITKLREHTEMATSLRAKNFPSVIETLTIKENLTDFFHDERFVAVNEKTLEITKKILVKINEYQPSLFEDISDFALGLTAQFALLRIHLLKFLAILPSLEHDLKGTEVKKILIEALQRFLKDNKAAKISEKKGNIRALPTKYLIAIKLIYWPIRFAPAKPLSFVIRYAVKLMAKRFIAGESIEKAEKSLKSLAKTNRDVTLDQLGELVVSEREADNYKNEVLKLIKGFSLHVKKGEKNKAGINKAHVSIKVSALCSDFKPQDFNYTYNLVSKRLIEIFKLANSEDVFINIDAEHYHYRDIVFKIYEKVLIETPELINFKNTGIVLQAYLRDANKHLKEIVLLAKKRGILMPIRLVKGAYWDAETVEGEANSFNAPQFLNKEETDIHFRQLIIEIYKSYPHVQLAIASHNFSDHAFAEATKELLFKEIGPIEHQCLHMTYEALSNALAKMEWATRNYVPVGSLLVGMAYLVRRIMENSSQVGVLTIMRSHKKHLNLKNPEEVHISKKREGKLNLDSSSAKLDDDFFNITPVRLYLESQKNIVENSLQFFQQENLMKFYPNKLLKNGIVQKIYSNSDPSILVGEIYFANIEDAKLAVNISTDAYLSEDWAKLSWAYRAAMLIKTATLMLAKRAELASLIVFESGKTAYEALGDVDEAIDFLNFYARSEAYLQKNYQDLKSRGPTAVISPWNFPLAIPCGMVAASLVAGNTVILKSAEQTPLIAQVLVNLFHEAGVPENAVIHLPGVGETVGDFLVKSEKISTVLFTGSKNVGMYISNELRKRNYRNQLTGKTYPAKAITEMGGKNAIIVTKNAELDETVSGILYSAFGHAGQKCSACSRVIVHNSVKEKLSERLREACKDISVGSALDFKTTINPIISKEDQFRIQKSVKEAIFEANNFGGKVIIDRSDENFKGYNVGPVIIELPKERVFDLQSFARKELFGPVLHLIGFDTLDEALKIYNSTEYALTGGVFGQSQNDIDYLMNKMESGNIYINRTITGARVSIEPFGGFKLSGTSIKAGGKHYVNALHQIQEKTPVLPSFKIKEGHEENFELCRPSKLSLLSKKNRMEKFLDQLISNFEFYFQGIQGDSKEILRDYKKWHNKNFENFISKNHNNRMIPGQLSFNNYALFPEHGVYVSVNDKPNIKSIIQVFSALSIGVGITICCRNAASYQWWQNLKEVLFNSGFSKENFDVFFVTNKELKRNLNHPKLSVIIYDGSIEEIETDVYQYLDEGKHDLRVKSILTLSDAIRTNDFYQNALNFIWMRSFAVNTMRHGAPLDLEI